MHTESALDFATLEAWFHFKPVDEEGRPTSEISRALLRFFQSHRDLTFSAIELSEEFNVDASLLQLICKQLEHMFLLRQDPADTGLFRVYRGSRNVQFRNSVWQHVSALTRDNDASTTVALPDCPESVVPESPAVYPLARVQPACRSVLYD